MATKILPWVCVHQFYILHTLIFRLLLFVGMGESSAVLMNSDSDIYSDSDILFHPIACFHFASNVWVILNVVGVDLPDEKSP